MWWSFSQIGHFKPLILPKNNSTTNLFTILVDRDKMAAVKSERERERDGQREEKEETQTEDEREGERGRGEGGGEGNGIRIKYV
jgi:hypothetical protein